MAPTPSSISAHTARDALTVFVIAFAHAKDTRAAITKRLATHGLSPTFIDAVDGRIIQETERAQHLNPERRKFLARILSPGALGCSLSHQHAWQALLDSNADCALILEDDAILSNSAHSVLNHLATRATDFDIVTLHHYKHRPLHLIDKLPSDHELSVARYNQIGAIAYMVSRDAAARLLVSSAPITFEIDVYMNRWWEHGISNLLVYPPIAQEDGRASTIGYTDKQPVWADDSLLLRLYRRINRMKDSMQKRLRFSAYLRKIQNNWHSGR